MVQKYSIDLRLLYNSFLSPIFQQNFKFLIYEKIIIFFLSFIFYKRIKSVQYIFVLLQCSIFYAFNIIAIFTVSHNLTSQSKFFYIIIIFVLNFVLYFNTNLSSIFIAFTCKIIIYLLYFIVLYLNTHYFSLPASTRVQRLFRQILFKIFGKRPINLVSILLLKS